MVILEEPFKEVQVLRNYINGEWVGGDAAPGDASRGFMAEALHQRGTFLDVSCAQGALRPTSPPTVGSCVAALKYRTRGIAAWCAVSSG